MGQTGSQGTGTEYDVPSPTGSQYDVPSSTDFTRPSGTGETGYGAGSAGYGTDATK